MDRTRIDEGVRRMRFASLLERQEGERSRKAEAAELLGVSERTFRRWRERYREEGDGGPGRSAVGPALAAAGA